MAIERELQHLTSIYQLFPNPNHPHFYNDNNTFTSCSEIQIIPTPKGPLISAPSDRLFQADAAARGLLRGPRDGARRGGAQLGDLQLFVAAQMDGEAAEVSALLLTSRTFF